ncbi:putative clathrin assembly protein At5g35200 isoform X2 [Magnolia sinica]|uniref:putative clathrin assembly protein At5g35200 isoform X2 n=1 Tax=Magnolia sinica TaxID=86752 RepID=UPI00265ABDEE|nr:putative clathrin assembly protein At5g35200 isoform X2 [Magnolia sinica]
MAVPAGTQQSIRKALGVLKDSTQVGLAKVNSDYKDLDIAIVKATNHVEHMAKEKHMRTIFDAISATRPRADVSYCIQTLARRLTKTHNWAVALKTLIIIHRALREVDPSFREELKSYTRSRGQMLNLSHFKDDSSPNAWDYSAWVRTYALYLEERLECFRILKYDVETEHTKTRELNTADMLEQLPALQRLLFRLLGCQVAGESVKLYSAINDGTLNLVDKFFEMQKHEAVRALDIYRKAGHQAEKLSEFYEICKGLSLLRGQKFIKIEQPAASFITAMEEYVKEAPLALPLQRNVGDDDKGVAPNPKVIKKLSDFPEKPQPSQETAESLKSEISKAPVTTPFTDDILGLNASSQKASQLDEKNALALAIVTSDNPLNTGNGPDLTSGATGWELALVSAPSSNENAVAESKLAGGLDKLTLDSLYDDAMARRTNQNGSYHSGQVAPNPYESAQYTQDPFYASNNIAPPTNVQMATMAKQQAFMMQQQQKVAGQQDTTNPFGNPYEETGVQSHPSNNPFTSLI